MSMPFYSVRAKQGFTIVELLIVIVVIAILAAITIVAYTGIQTRAIESTIQSDIENSAKTVELDQVRDGTYPASASAANGGLGLRASGENTITYTVKSYGYCINVTNPKINKVFRFRSDTKTTDQGLCSMVVTHFAGSYYAGFSDGTGSSALFNNPFAIAYDKTTNVFYVSDTLNHRIRKITPSGVVTTFAGSGTAGFANGTGTAAQFNSPAGITVDSIGNVYVADSANHRIRRITPGGVVSTFAGSGTQGTVDGTGTGAQLDYPSHIAINSSGTLYVSAPTASRIRQITSGGVVSTFAGSGAQGYLDGNSTTARFSIPAGLTIDSSGNVYVADYQNHRIRKITPGGDVSTVAGSGVPGSADGTATSAQFTYPGQLTISDTGVLYVSSSNLHLRTISAAGVVSTLSEWGFSDPGGLTFDTSGHLFVVEKTGHAVKQISL